MKFIDRITERNFLINKNTSEDIEKILIWGECGIGKSELVKQVYNIEESLYIDKSNENYFFNMVLKLVKLGFNQFLLNNKNCNYKDLFYSSNKNISLTEESLAKFILENSIFIGLQEYELEEIMAKYIIKLKTIKYIILEDIQICSAVDCTRLSKFINYICMLKPDQKLSIIFTLSENQGSLYNYFLSICDKTIMLRGLEVKYIEIFLQEYFDNDSLECEELANYLLEKYSGNLGKISSLLKQKISNDRTKNQNSILKQLLLPEFYNNDPTEERILLFLTVLPLPISMEKMVKYLMADSDFANIENSEICKIKIKNLVAKELIIEQDGILQMKQSTKLLLWEQENRQIHSIHLIYNLQKKFEKNFSDTENSDCLYFIIGKNSITIDAKVQKKFFRYTTNAAVSFAKNELWKKSISYFERVFSYIDLFDEKLLTIMLKTFYYGADYSKIAKFINEIDDTAYLSYDYWYWKGNIFFMINDSLSVACFDKAIDFAKNLNERLQAQIMRKEAISELPEYCHQTLQYYRDMLNEYKDTSFPALPLLYRNSLAVGGNETIELCNKGIMFAQKYNQYEETLKLKHNQQFELFRMGKYTQCFEVFEQIALYFQKSNKRLYESAYGFNNLALFELVHGNYENARLYAMSAVIYASTPYSQIATNVNYNLILSHCEKDVDALYMRIQKIEKLLCEFNIQDSRMYRKAYFSITIACICEDQLNKAREYLIKVEPYLQEGRHINRYYNLCINLNINPKVIPQEIITQENEYYNFYANPNYELWLLAFGHI